jgi:hypothetical protein
MIDLTGRVFGRWEVLGRAQNRANSGAYWLCKCFCGRSKEVARRSLVSGCSNSCGCLRSELQSASMKTEKAQQARTIHGKTHTKEYKILATMKDRCYNPKNPKYHRYGGRGIKICDSWLESVSNFIADMGLKPEGKSIDRIDNDKSYCKENCRWATYKEQAQNRVTNVNLSYAGTSQCASEWAAQLLVPKSKITQRLKRGWSVEKTLTTT